MTEAKTQEGTNVHSNRVYWAVFWLIVAAGVMLRWLELDARPVHHDESLHLMYGRYFFDWPDHHFYKYDPMLHGPLLYNVLRLVYNTLGSTTWAGRSLVCLLGTVFIFGPWFFRRYLTRGTLLALTAGVALSPTLVYWSRFIREDNLQLAGMLLMLAGVLLARGGMKALVVFVGLAIQFCEKENSFVTVALLAGFIAFEAAFRFFFDRKAQSMALELWCYVKTYWKETALGFGIAAFIYSYFYSAGFRYSEGILDGIYRKSLAYWTHQHDIERIAGPFLFHIYMLTWYELLFLVLMLVQVGLFYAKADRPIKYAGAGMLFLAILAAVLSWGDKIPEMPLWKFFKLKDLRDVVGIVLILIHPVIATTQHLMRRERALAFWGYFFFASLFTYSYLGEKVPWLTVYPLTAGMVYLALYFQDYFAKGGEELKAEGSWAAVLHCFALLLVSLGIIFLLEEGLGVEGQKTLFDKIWVSGNLYFIGAGLLIALLSLADRFFNIFGPVNYAAFALGFICLFNLRAAVLTNFTFAGKASEFISQVHTTHDFHNLALKIREEMLNPLNGVPPKVLGIEDSVWPITWYMVDVPEFKFDAPENERQNFDYIFKNWKEGPDAPPVPAGFRSIRLNLRGWWVPDYDKMTLKKVLHYSLNHRPWSDTGFSYLTVLIKEKQ